MNISYNNIHSSRNKIIDKIVEEKKKNPNYKVIDIGGAMVGWSSEYVDFIADKNIENSSKSIQLDICDESSWLRFINNLDTKYDLAICTHTLEDVYNPFLALKYLPVIAREGFITMPSTITECSYVESSLWLGYIHHRWIFAEEDDEMIIVPKLGVLAPIVNNSIKYNRDVEEIMFHWKDIIKYKIFMDNFLGPNADAVIDNLVIFLNRQIKIIK